AHMRRAPRWGCADRPQAIIRSLLHFSWSAASTRSPSVLTALSPSSRRLPRRRPGGEDTSRPIVRVASPLFPHAHGGANDPFPQAARALSLALATPPYRRPPHNEAPQGCLHHARDEGSSPQESCRPLQRC